MATKNGRSSTHSSQNRSGSHSRSSSGSHKGRGNGSSAKSSKSHPTSSRSSSSKRSGSKKSSSSTGVRGKATKIASKVGGTIKQHPVLTAVGAGAGLLIAEGVRRAISGSGSSSKSRKSRSSSDEDDDEDAGAEDSYESSDEADEDEGEEDSDDDEDDSSHRGGVMGSAREGFDRGREIASAGWQKYPLIVCGLALGLGALAGMVLPSSSLEDETLGPAAGKISKKLKSAGKAVKELASKAYEEATTAASEEAERVGITPHRLGRKVKHVAVKVRDAVTDAVQG